MSGVEFWLSFGIGAATVVLVLIVWRLLTWKDR